MNSKRILGIALLAVGIVLFVLGMNATDSLGESVQEGITGSYSDKTTWYLIGGAVLTLVGGALAALASREGSPA